MINLSYYIMISFDHVCINQNPFFNFLIDVVLRKQKYLAKTFL